MSAVLTAVACAPATIGLAPLGMLIVPVYTRRRHDRAAARVAAAVCLADRSWRREQLRQVHDRQDFRAAVAGARDEWLARQVHAALTAPRDPHPTPGVDVIAAWWTPAAIGRPPVTARRVSGATLTGAAAA